MPPKNKQKRMPAITDTQTRSRNPASERGLVWLRLRRPLGVQTTQEAFMEATEEETMGAIQEALQGATQESKRTVDVFKEEDKMKLKEFLIDNEL